MFKVVLLVYIRYDGDYSESDMVMLCWLNGYMNCGLVMRFCNEIVKIPPHRRVLSCLIWILSY